MSKHALILLRNDASLAIAITEDAQLAKVAALDNARMIQVVGNPKGNEIAVAAQAACRALLNACEASRKDVKAPVLDYGRLIDQTAKDFAAELATEEMRLSRLIGNYQEAEIARVRSEEAARNEALTLIERQREAELSQVNDLKQREVIHERYSQEVQSVPLPKPVPKAEGQMVTEPWQFEVTDIHEVYKRYPSLVKLEPRRADIIEALKSGLQIPGIRAWKETKSTVRT